MTRRLPAFAPAALAALVLLAAPRPAPAADPPAKPADLKYLWATAYHVPPETTTEDVSF